MDQGAEVDGDEFRPQGNDGGELGSAGCQPAGLKAWPSLRVRCSGYQLKRTRDRLISSNLISDFRRVTTNRSQVTDFDRLKSKYAPNPAPLLLLLRRGSGMTDGVRHRAEPIGIRLRCVGERCLADRFTIAPSKRWAEITVANQKFNSLWDPLRKDARFENLCQNPDK